MDMLAAKMRDKGYSWTKTTVFNIEHGKRPIRLAEAADVLVCLKVSPATNVFELLRSEKEHIWISNVGQVSLAEDQVYNCAVTYTEKINQLKKFLGSDDAKVVDADMSRRLRHWIGLSNAQLKVASILVPYIQGIIAFFEEEENNPFLPGGARLPLVFVDGEFKRLEYKDFDKDVEEQLKELGATDYEIKTLKERALRIEKAKSGE